MPKVAVLWVSYVLHYLSNISQKFNLNITCIRREYVNAIKCGVQYLLTTVFVYCLLFNLSL